ncbi:MAG: DNA-3-methyladenine glycosylase 2 [Thermoplasmata archaeon]
MFIPFEGPLNLSHTLGCGQAFRWRQEGDWYLGTVGGFALKVRVKGRTLEARSNSPLSPGQLSSYFRLEDDLDEIYDSIAVDDHIRVAIRRYRGLRLLRQQPWECLASYIISIASNIPRISATIERISERYGNRLQLEAWETHSFPSPGALARAGPRALRRLGLGFRARYLCSAAKAVQNGQLDFDELSKLSSGKAREELMALAGVGPKVADCVLLFSLGRLEVFPVDRWVRRAVERLFFNGKELTENNVREWGMNRYGPFAGYAQQYLFHYIRHLGL